MLTRGAGRKTGSYSLWSSWSWREGVRTCPRDPPVTGQPQQDGKQQECWPGSLSAALGATVPFLLALQNQGVFPSPSPLFLPPLHHLVLPWGEWCCRGKPHPDKIIVGWHCCNSEGSGECLGAGIASLIANALMEKRALGIHISWAPVKPSSSYSIAGNLHPGKSVPGVTFTDLNNLFIFVFV